MKDSLLVGITSYNCLHYLKHNIATIKRSSDQIDIEILVVDNCSSDGTREWLSGDYLEGPSHIKSLSILNSFNGFAAYGCHQSIDYFLTNSNARYFLHLDPDSEIKSETALADAIRQLVSNEKLGAVGEKLYGLRFQHPKARSLKKFDQHIFGPWTDKFVPYKSWSRQELENILLEKHPSQDYMVYRELCGNFMMFKREVVEKIGNVDACMFKMWRWDSEYSMRCMLFGYELEQAKIIRRGQVKHFGGRSRLRETDPHAYLKKVSHDLGAA